jgi:hypothetical protein
MPPLFTRRALSRRYTRRADLNGLENEMTAQGTNRSTTPPPVAGGRHSTGVVVGAGIAGLALGAAAAFAITGLVFTVRVELPPPPYPQLSSTPPPPGSSVSPPSPPSVGQTSVPSLVPMPPPLPPGPR